MEANTTFLSFLRTTECAGDQDVISAFKVSFYLGISPLIHASGFRVLKADFFMAPAAKNKCIGLNVVTKSLPQKSAYDAEK